jgi:hypothetical protein
LVVGALKVIDIKVKRGARQPSLAKGVEAVNTKAVEDIHHFHVVNNNLVSCWVNRPPFGYDIPYSICNARVSKPEANDLFACGVEVIIILNRQKPSNMAKVGRRNFIRRVYPKAYEIGVPHTLCDEGLMSLRK